MKLDSLEQNWNALGEEDPLWAILSDPGKRGRTWELSEFLATAQPELDDLFAELGARGIEVRRRRALDFGCGVGRLTQALAGRFDHCDGIDVAASMIEGAVRLNRQGERCHFHHNPTPDLRLFPDRSFDFVLSLLVFQHMEPALMKGYLREFVRVLDSDGVAYFNIPDRYALGTELAPAAARASIECIEMRPALRPREVLPLKLLVGNESELVWPASATLKVGNHWRSADGEMLVRDDARAPIETALPPGGSCELELAVVAPDAAGTYLLELDLVQEHRGWFADLGSPTLRLPISVSGGDAATASVGHAAAAHPATDPSPSSGDLPLASRIEMHVMSREETVAVIEAEGGVVLDVVTRDRCGPSVPSFDYVVGRASVRAKRSPPRGRQPESEDPAPNSSSALRTDPEGLRSARERLGDRSDLLSFRLSSQRRWLGPPSVALRALLRRLLLEVLHRQTEFNRASSILAEELEAQIEQLQRKVGAQADSLAVAHQQIKSLEAGEHEPSDSPAPE